MYENLKLQKKDYIVVILAIIGLIYLFSPAIYGQDLKLLHEKTFQTSPGKKLTVEGSSGDIIITTWDKSEVFVKISCNDNALEKMQFKMELVDDGILVKGERKSTDWFSNIRVKYEVIIPSKYSVYAKTSGGDINIKNVDGKIELNTSGGDIDVQSSVGKLNGKTSGGDVDIKNQNGDIDVKTSGGDITLSGIKGDVNCKTSGGDIEIISNDGKINGSTSGGDITLDYSGPNKGVELSTSGGDIKILVPSDFGAKAELKTSGGKVSCNLNTSNVVEIKSTKFEADLNNGGAPLICKTSGGSISVKKK